MSPIEGRAEKAGASKMIEVPDGLRAVGEIPHAVRRRALRVSRAVDSDGLAGGTLSDAPSIENEKEALLRGEG
jgi:hypothetical protein